MALRFASAADAAALLAIYGQYLDTPVTFEQDLPSEAEFARRIASYGGTHPYLVWEEGGRPVGYAYAHQLGERTAYQWSAELSVYLDRGWTARGIGRPFCCPVQRMKKEKAEPSGSASRFFREISPCRRGRSSPWCRGSCPTGCR